MDEHSNKQKVAQLDGSSPPEAFKMARPKFRDVRDTRPIWEFLKTRIPDITVMFENKGNDEQEEQQHQGQETDNEMDWRGEEEEEDSGYAMEREGAETEDAEMEGTGAEDAEMEAQYMVERFASSIEEYGRTEIWNNRCNVTIAWEKTISITARSKKTRSSSGNDDFNALNPQHRKPEMEAIQSTADNIVLESYLGQRRLHLMERGGGIKL
ncbi:hypothetical protein BG000_003131 [Podila horticola]|nr:hypothetical protein BG000_003131 [Podila horticola]